MDQRIERNLRATASSDLGFSNPPEPEFLKNKTTLTEADRAVLAKELDSIEGYLNNLDISVSDFDRFEGGVGSNKVLQKTLTRKRELLELLGRKDS